MKTILLLRHAKSDWSNPSLSDFERPLAKRGEKDAPRMGNVLLRLRCMPDLIVSSPAMRTKMTAQLVTMQSGYRDEIHWEDSLYGGGVFDFMDVLKRLPREIERPMLVGHNPGVEETISHLMTPGSDNPYGTMKIRIPTAGLVYLEADIANWNELKPGTCILHWFLIPRLVKAMK